MLSIQLLVLSGFMVTNAYAAPPYLPVDNSVITAGWDYSSGDFHSGIDFDGINCSTRVLAAAGGTVSYAKNTNCYKGDAGFGCSVEITHSDGSQTKYSHLCIGMVTVAENATVVAGETIGYVGNTGNVQSTTGDGSHLDFRVAPPGCDDWDLDSSCLVDPYDIEGYASAYPDDATSKNCGSNFLWAECPPVPADSCTLTTVDTYTDPYPMGLVTITEDGSAFDFHQYYVEGREYVLLNRGDMGTEYANPVINDQGSTTYHYQWLSGDVDGDGYTDIVEVQHTASTVFREEVWLSNGDGSFQSEATWQTVGFLLWEVSSCEPGNKNLDNLDYINEVLETVRVKYLGEILKLPYFEIFFIHRRR